MKKLYIISLFNCLCLFNLQAESPFSQSIDYYTNEGDSLKVCAVKFLEKNMNHHYSKICTWQDSLGNDVKFDEFMYLKFNESQETFDKLFKRHKLRPNYRFVFDKDVFSEQMIRRIVDEGFLKWRKSWNANVDFETFCEYLLPYRIQDEPLEISNNKVNSLFVAYEKRSKAETCDKLNMYLNQWFKCSFAYENRYGASYRLSLSQMFFRQAGFCDDMCNLSVYGMRALGIPCGVDFTPYWATSSYSHAWCTYIDEQGKFCPFEGVYGRTKKYLDREPGKVFRITYSAQSESLAFQRPVETIPSGHLRIPYIKDVTSEYWRTHSFEAPLDQYIQDSIAYVCVFNSLDWKVIDWVKVVHGSAHFRHLAVGVVYLPVSYDGVKVTPVGDPILLHDDKTVQLLSPNYEITQDINIVENVTHLIFRSNNKYHFYYWDKKWVYVGAKMSDETKKLSFKNIPSNTLYLLVPEYSRHKERIFTLNKTNGIQYW